MLFKQFLVLTCAEAQRVLKECVSEFSEDLKSDEFLDEYEYLSNYNQRIMEICGELVKLNLEKELLTFIVSDIANYFEISLKNPLSYFDYLYPLCYYTDMIEFGPETTAKGFSEQSLVIDKKMLVEKTYEEIDLV